MNLNFNDTSIIIRYLQQFIKEVYNRGIYVTGQYYKTFDMNYGMAHYIAKYLDYKYPILDTNTKDVYNNIEGRQTRSIKLPISISNYFLCDNKGHRLEYNYQYIEFINPVTGEPEYKTKNPSNDQQRLYEKIYNKYMRIVELQNPDDPMFIPKVENLYGDKYVIKNDLPLFISLDNEEKYQINTNTIFTLDSWNIQKGICEIDDFIGSYLLGRTITPKSSKEEIYYVQKLMYHNDVIPKEIRGTWCPKGEEGSYFDLTQAIISFQSQNVNVLNTVPMFVTGYFDIFTEAQILKDLGETKDGILGL